jgi:hypothetical protein
MTLEEFKKLIKDLWTTELMLSSSFLPLEYGEVYNKLVEKYAGDFYTYNYTEAIDKEVEAIWLRKNTKLGKSLK